MEQFRRLPAYVDFRDPADAERYEKKVRETLAIYADPEEPMVLDDEVGDAPALLLRQVG